MDSSTCRLVVAAAVRARLAAGVEAAGVGVAQVLPREAAARLERVAGEAFGARADGRVVLDVAVGAAAAHLSRPEARVLAVEVHASLLVVAVVVLGALGVAPGLR